MAATTLMDDAGATYLLPNGDYDFSISEELHDKGLQDGEVVYAEGHAVALKFPAEEDLVSLPAVINASIGVEDAVTDVEQAIVLFADLATRMAREMGVVPSDMTIDAVAVDRTKNTAVLLPPFKVSHDTNVYAALEGLYRHAMERAHTFQEQQIIQKAWRSALEKVKG